MDTLHIFLFAILGWFAWSLGHYLIHRGWHRLIYSADTGLRDAVPFVRDEMNHHHFYDHADHETTMDTDGRYGGFPLSLAIVAVTVVAGGLAFLADPYLVFTFWLAAAGSACLDILVHREAHRADAEGYFALRHRRHHLFWVGNYSFATGVLWDYLFGTELLPHEPSSLPSSAQ